MPRTERRLTGDTPDGPGYDDAAPAGGPFGGFVRALVFAAHKHRAQRRKDAAGSPYINHPIALADVLANEGGVTDPVVLCAAVLHDTIEDTETSADEVAREFGAKIASVVAEVTDDKRLPKDERKRRQIEHAPDLSPEAKLVKLADKICNLRDVLDAPPAGWPIERKRGYFDWAERVVDGLRGSNPRLEAVFDGLLERRDELR
ncbi:MAG: bifunctional (p)ppGpp synthetase/guanosine-3',5'-bis(diphosphate) 3'-pyrophosphohydrolase [Burkholderiales bacterium]|nr:bifunctional (p)ppGpp synthetase/guanosine-3',5'-bis(diphosphate) 3'-pyrophosphohydrolase [Burkholderiales bacterium]MCC7114809.1 bifunctional (p)ppGpp synthetase/guanosine-3',5'-bis(diphosphate) 3'-pyrophosphohydrolase [Burkholderiales bacterium]